MPATTSRKFPYPDDLALAVQSFSFETGQKVLEDDLHIMSWYYDRWRLSMNAKKTEVSVFHLENRAASHQLDVKLGDELIRHSPTPKYLGVVLDRSLTYRPHLEQLSQKLKTRNNLIQKISGTDWGADGNTLRTAALALIYSAAEYCAPAWYNSSHKGKIDVQLNSAMRLVTGTMKSTPTPWLHVLSNIAPPQLRRKSAAHREWHRSLDDVALPIRSELINPPRHRMCSRNPIWLDLEIQNNSFDTNDAWMRFWDESGDFSNKTLIECPSQKLEGFDLPRKSWKMVNRFRCGHGGCGHFLRRWDQRDSPTCDGQTDQTMNHIINGCPIHLFLGGLNELNELTDAANEWLKNLDLSV